jgi:hypothetical protein
MRVLIGCESSGIVRDAFRARGHDSWSCDLLPSDSPFHFQCALQSVPIDDWDLGIFHPPCTYLSVSGMHWTTRGLRDPQLTADALEFVRWILALPIERIALENPVSIISTHIRKPDQTIQPWQFGHDASKKTCLWLKGLPPLVPTQLIAPRLFCCGVEVPNNDKYGCPNCDQVARPRWGNQTASGQNKLGPSADRWKLRSATYPGIADAMASQWGGL